MVTRGPVHNVPFFRVCLFHLPFVCVIFLFSVCGCMTLCHMVPHVCMCLCSQTEGHPSCLDMTEELVRVIQTYHWQCMECKTCTVCQQPHHEDEMMFCDKCDRGYHTFCVGMDSIPNGEWMDPEKHNESWPDRHSHSRRVAAL